MNISGKQKLREFLKETLAKHGDRNDLTDSESIFVSGRLDSFSMMMLVMHLEESFGIDFSSVEFDVGLLDSVNEIEFFVDSRSEK